MTALRSLLFNALGLAVTVVLLVAGLPLLLMPRRATTGLVWLWGRSLLWLLARVVGLRHQVRGRERIPPGPVIFAVKHQSAWETIAFGVLTPDFAAVVKRELTWIPLFGWYMRRAGHVSVDRAGGAAALRRMAKDARARIARGQNLVVFPEGTRTAPGGRPRYQPGIAALYRNLGIPVVPVALNSGLFWGRRTFVKHPGVITVEFLEPIGPGLDRGAFMAELERRIETATRRLCREAGAAADGGAAPA